MTPIALWIYVTASVLFVIGLIKICGAIMLLANATDTRLSREV